MIDAVQESRRGMLWLGSATVLSRALDVAASLFAISLLSRDALGSAALVLSVGEVLEAASGLGLGQAMVRAKELRPAQTQSVFWLASALGFGLFLLLVLLAPLVAWVYGTPAIMAMIMVTGGKHVLLGAALVPQQLLTRDLRFRATGAIQTLCTLGVGLTKISLAALGFGAWALVLSNLMRGVLMLVCALAFSGFRPRFHFRISEVREHWQFGLRVTGSSLLQQAARNADYFLVGRLLGVEALGVYSVAYELGMQALEVLASLINRVSYPIYARVAHEARELKAALLRSTRAWLLIGAPLAVVMHSGAHDLVAVAAGERWADAAPIMQVLVFGALLRGAAQLFPSIYLACGRADYALFDALLSGASLVSALLVALTLFRAQGLNSVPWAWLAVYPLIVSSHLVLVRRFVPLRVSEYLRASAPGVGGALLLWMALPCVKALLPAGFGHMLSLLTLLLVALVLYLAYLRAALGMGLAGLRPQQQVRAVALPV